MLSCEKQGIMTKSQKVEMIMGELRAEIEAFVSLEDEIKSSVEYEVKVLEICRSMVQKLVRGDGEVCKKGRNAKKKY